MVSRRNKDHRVLGHVAERHGNERAVHFACSANRPQFYALRSRCGRLNYNIRALSPIITGKRPRKDIFYVFFNLKARSDCFESCR